MFEANLVIQQQPRPDSLESSADRPARLLVRRSRNTEALHLVKQRGSLQAESGGRSFRTTEPPLRALAGCNNFSTYLFFKCRVDDLWLLRLTGLERPWFKDAIIGKNDATLAVVLQLSNVTGPGMANQDAHGFLRDGFDCFAHGAFEPLNEVFHELGDIGFPRA